MSLTDAEKKALRQEWGTPSEFFRICDREFQFRIDAAANFKNTMCDYYIGPDHYDSNLIDMYKADWMKLAYDEGVDPNFWLNPPFRTMMPVVQLAKYWADRGATTAVMGPLAPDTEWHDYCDRQSNASEIRNLRPRVQYISPHPEIKTSTNMGKQCLVVFRPNKPRNLKCHTQVWNWREA